MSSPTFGEESVKEFFKKISEMLANLTANPPKTPYPTNCFYHGFGGSVEGKPYKFAVALLLTTNEGIAKDFEEDFRRYSLLKKEGKGPDNL